MAATKEEMSRMLRILRRPMEIRPPKEDSNFLDMMEKKMSPSQIRSLPKYAKIMMGI